MVFEEKHMHYVAVSFGLSLGLQIWMQQLQLREANSIMHAAVKRMTVSLPCLLQIYDCIYSWNKHIKTKISYFPPSNYKMTCPV